MSADDSAGLPRRALHAAVSKHTRRNGLRTLLNVLLVLAALPTPATSPLPIGAALKLPWLWRRFNATASTSGVKPSPPAVATTSAIAAVSFGRWQGIAATPPPPPPPPEGTTFSAGSGAVEVRASGNVTALLAYNPAAEPAAGRSNVTNATNSPPPSSQQQQRVYAPVHAPTDAELAFRDLLLSKRLPYDATQPYKLPTASYVDSDFVFVTASYPARYVLAQASRSWRRGIRAFIAVNNSGDVAVLNARNKVHGEVYGYFPDEGGAELGRTYHGARAGDSRLALTPFLAHEALGDTYKWMLYGDDDTLFYMPAVKRLLARLDPELPLAVSDNLWYGRRHPNFFAPRCLPCHLAVDADPAPAEAAGAEPARAREPLRLPNVTELVEGYKRFILGVRAGANMSSPEVQRRMNDRYFRDLNSTLARLAALGLGPNAELPGLRYSPRPACPFCTTASACSPPAATTTTPAALQLATAVAGLSAQLATYAAGKAGAGLIPGCHPAPAHGGGGVILSVGLLRRLSLARMRECVGRIRKATGSDALFSTCLWVAGYAFTDPGGAVLGGYDGSYVALGPEATRWALHDPLSTVLHGKCDARCRWALRNAASQHARGRGFQTYAAAGAHLYGTLASYGAVRKWMAFTAQFKRDAAEVAALAAAARAEGGDGGGGRKTGGGSGREGRRRELIEDSGGGELGERDVDMHNRKLQESSPAGLAGAAELTWDWEAEASSHVEAPSAARRRGGFDGRKLR